MSESECVPPESEVPVHVRLDVWIRRLESATTPVPEALEGLREIRDELASRSSPVQRHSPSLPNAPVILVCDDDPLVRGHAAWALGRIAGNEAAAALEARLEIEEDGWVRTEIGLALVWAVATQGRRSQKQLTKMALLTRGGLLP